VEKYACATTVSIWDPDMGTLTITAIRFNGSTGNGGYDTWQLDHIDILAADGTLLRHYGHERDTHTNPGWPTDGSTQGFVFSVEGLPADVVVRYCFHHHQNAMPRVPNPNGGFIDRRAIDDHYQWLNYPGSGASYDAGKRPERLLVITWIPPGDIPKMV